MVVKHEVSDNANRETADVGETGMEDDFEVRNATPDQIWHAIKLNDTNVYTFYKMFK